MTIRVGVIGAGVMGAEHARILHSSASGASVTAVADPVKERAHAVAVETGAWPFSSAEELRALTSTRPYAADWRPVFADAYRLQSQAWIDALTPLTRSPLATAEEALNATIVAQALVQSMNQGGATIHITDLQSAPPASSSGADQERTPTHVH